jgi:hypothetical protein
LEELDGARGETSDGDCRSHNSKICFSPRVDPSSGQGDCVIGSHTAALIEPYADSGTRGDSLLDPAAMTRYVTLLDAIGFQVDIHAIGDRGISTASPSTASWTRSQTAPSRYLWVWPELVEILKISSQALKNSAVV